MMTEFFLRKLPLISIIVFTAGITIAVLAYLADSPKSSRMLLGFTMTSKQTATKISDGVSIQKAMIVRYQKSDGTFRLATTFYSQDGKEKQKDTFGLPGRGVFEVALNNNRLNFLSPMELNRPLLTEFALRNDTRFLKEDYVLGYKTYVLRFQKEGDNAYTDIYYAPDLQGLPIKHVIKSDTIIHIIEPEKIELGDPDDSILQAMPDLPVDYEFFEQQKKPVSH